MTVAQWGIYPWFQHHGVARIHPSDLARFRDLSPPGKVFRTAGTRGAFLVLTYGPQQFRVAPDLFHPLAIDPLPIGTRVRLAGSRIEGVVRDIVWLSKEQTVLYFLAFAGRRHNEAFDRRSLEPLDA